MFGAADDGYYWNFARADTLFQDTARTTPAANGDPVGGVTDLSGKGRHAAQATATARPLRGTDGSGRPWSFYDGVDDFLGFADGNSAPVVTTVIAAGPRVSGGRMFGTADSHSVFVNGANWDFAFNGASAFVTLGANNVPQVFAERLNTTASLRLYRGLTLVANTTALVNPNRGACLAASEYASPLFFSSLGIYAAFSIRRVLTDAEFNFVVTRFGALSGVTV